MEHTAVLIAMLIVMLSTRDSKTAELMLLQRDIQGLSGQPKMHAFLGAALVGAVTEIEGSAGVRTYVILDTTRFPSVTLAVNGGSVFDRSIFAPGIDPNIGWELADPSHELFLEEASRQCVQEREETLRRAMREFARRDEELQRQAALIAAEQTQARQAECLVRLRAALLLLPRRRWQDLLRDLDYVSDLIVSESDRRFVKDLSGRYRSSFGFPLTARQEAWLDDILMRFGGVLRE